MSRAWSGRPGRTSCGGSTPARMTTKRKRKIDPRPPAAAAALPHRHSREPSPRPALTRISTMPALAVVRCILCNRLAELPRWQRVAVDQTDGGEVFTVDVPLCLKCEERTRPAEDVP